MSTPRKKAAPKAAEMTRQTVTKFPFLSIAVVAGITLFFGIAIGNMSDSGPTPAVAQTPYVPTTGTPAIKVPEPRNHETKDSLIVSDNSGEVNLGGVHYHVAAVASNPPNRTPTTVIQPTLTRIVEVPVVVERIVEREPVRIWTRPGIPEDSRLGRTLAALRRFEDAGVRITVEE